MAREVPRASATTLNPAFKGSAAASSPLPAVADAGSPMLQAVRRRKAAAMALAGAALLGVIGAAVWLATSSGAADPNEPAEAELTRLERCEIAPGITSGYFCNATALGGTWRCSQGCCQLQADAWLTFPVFECGLDVAVLETRSGFSGCAPAIAKLPAGSDLAESMLKLAAYGRCPWPAGVALLRALALDRLVGTDDLRAATSGTEPRVELVLRTVALADGVALGKPLAGAALLAATDEGGLRWTAEDGEDLVRLEGPDSLLTLQLAGDRLVCADDDGALQVLEVPATMRVPPGCLFELLKMD